MKKTLLIGSILVCLGTGAFAQPQICPFTDYFNINAPAAATITSLTSDGNINAAATDLTHFKTYCRDNTKTESGTVALSVSTNTGGCSLKILDGPFEMNPTVIYWTCSGKLNYAGMDHKTGTYTYTLKFN